MTLLYSSPKRLAYFALLLFLLVCIQGSTQARVAFAQQRNQSVHATKSDDDSHHGSQSSGQEKNDDSNDDDNGQQPSTNPTPSPTPSPDEPNPASAVSADELLSALEAELASELDEDTVASDEVSQLQTPDIFRTIAESGLVKTRVLTVDAESDSGETVALLASGCFTACSIDFTAKLLPVKKNKKHHRCRKSCTYKVSDSEELEAGEPVVFSLENLKRLIRLIPKGKTGRLRVTLSVQSDNDLFVDQEKNVTFAVKVN